MDLPVSFVCIIKFHDGKDNSIQENFFEFQLIYCYLNLMTTKLTFSRMHSVVCLFSNDL